jgi:hypothetical protein
MAQGSGRVFGIVNALMGAMFLLSAALQLNDPDPLWWIVTYVAAGVACFIPRRMPGYLALPVVVGTICLVWAISMAPETLPILKVGDLAKTMQAETPAIELGREMLGLAILAAWMGALVFVSVKERRPAA